jgi:splicing factor 3A subunit 3
MATLERLRSALEDIEELDRLVVAELDGSSAKTQREQITSDHKLATILRASHERARMCLDLYKDEDGLRKAEVESMSGPVALANFYDQLRSTKEYHRRFPDAAASLPSLKEQLERDSDAEGKFSGEESVGRYVDLNSFYQRFVNLPGNRRHAKLDYRSYLDVFADFPRQGIPAAQKRAVYQSYVADLGDYLRGFYERCNPLADMDELAAKAEEGFASSLEGAQSKPG